MDTSELGLGRRFAPDPRDRRFLMSALLPDKTTRTYRYWCQNGFWGFQGNTPQCVGYAWAHWIEDSPITHPDPDHAAILSPDLIYHEAQMSDEWPGEDYEGTSVRGGAIALQLRQLIGNYHWAYDVHTVALAVLEAGPVIMGTNWYSTMDKPHIVDPYGDFVIDIAPTAYIRGGHAWVINGVNTTKGLFRMKNSWGRNWGKEGNAWLTFETVQRLIQEDGEACIATEVKLAA